MLYKNILIDMGNVVFDFSPDYVLTKFTTDPKLINQIKNATIYQKYWALADDGRADDDDIINHGKTFLNKEHHPVLEDFVRNWYKHKTEKMGMTQIFKELKDKGYKLILCSNTAKTFWDYRDEIEMFKLLDGEVISADIQLSKPDRKYFEYALSKYDMKAEECLFIDDTIGNCKAAYECGIDNYWFNGNIELFREYLEITGIL